MTGRVGIAGWSLAGRVCGGGAPGPYGAAPPARSPPHERQNRAPGLTGPPQCGHVCAAPGGSGTAGGIDTLGAGDGGVHGAGGPGARGAEATAGESGVGGEGGGTCAASCEGVAPAAGM